MKEIICGQVGCLLPIFVVVYVTVFTELLYTTLIRNIFLIKLSI